ncbi:MAG: GxxExxY protein [Chthoniobacterales bacterium]|nr:GxxExxY protein [Chthoniobacterales bacterium]
MDENEIGSAVVDCAVALPRDLWPGLLETVYEVTLARALERRGLRVERQVAVPIEYEGERFAEGFRADVIVEGKVLLELKSVEHVTPAHKKQLLTYLRLTGLKLGYLLNFGEALMRDGITRIINGSLDPIPLSTRASVRGNSSEEGFSQRHKGIGDLKL